MSTYTQIVYQIVFGSRNRITFLNPENEEILFAYIAGILKKQNCHSYIVGGYSDHIHIVTHIHPTIAPANLIKDIKIACHKMMKENRLLFSKFNGWQTGYGLFTYHISAKENLIRYVIIQKEHHKKTTFIDELLSLLKDHKIKYIEEYIFK